jgi:hypothetical protein
MADQIIDDLEEYRNNRKQIPSINEIKILKQIKLHLQALHIVGLE